MYLTDVLKEDISDDDTNAYKYKVLIMKFLRSKESK